MIGLDTNVLVRYLAQDDARQGAIAVRLIEHELSAAQPGFISLVVLVETCWVLKRLYSATQAELVDTVTDMLNTAQFEIEQREAVQAAAHWVSAAKSSKAELTDRLIAQIALRAGCTHTLSFDKGAVRAAGMVLLA